MSKISTSVPKNNNPLWIGKTTAGHGEVKKNKPSNSESAVGGKRPPVSKKYMSSKVPVKDMG